MLLTGDEGVAWPSRAGELAVAATQRLVMVDETHGSGEPLLGRALRVGSRLSLSRRDDFERHAVPTRGGSRLAGFGVAEHGKRVSRRGGEAYVRGWRGRLPARGWLARVMGFGARAGFPHVLPPLPRRSLPPSAISSNRESSSTNTSHALLPSRCATSATTFSSSSRHFDGLDAASLVWANCSAPRRHQASGSGLRRRILLEGSAASLSEEVSDEVSEEVSEKAPPTTT